ncbi:TonB-dependent receptor domain-containing protein [Aurantivibrio infirmus]
MKKHGLYLGIAACTMALPLGIQAQEEVALEELVVTGSYIKRDKFESPSPTEVITADQIRQQGAVSMGQVVRDLSITQNTDTVANILGTQDGGQDSATAQFNLRGLGGSSTLTLFDGRRSVTQNVQSLVPDIALEQVQIVLDGGATAYGSDAVAGVVNFIPIKEYDGVKISTYYAQDDGGDYSDPKIAILGGKSFDNGLKWVGALDYHKRSALLRDERPTYLAYDDDDSIIGQPGVYERSAFNAGSLTDPSCGVTDPNPALVDDSNSGALPSGRTDTEAFGPFVLPVCRFEFGEFQDYARPVEETLAYTNLSYEISDSLTLEFQANWTNRESTSSTSPSTGNSTSNEFLDIPTTHPDFPAAFGTTLSVRPKSSFWRPFGKYGTLPSQHKGGSTQTTTESFTQRYKFGASYNFADTSWGGETWLSYQNSTTDTTGSTIRQSRLDASLHGLGGPGCGFDSDQLIGLDRAAADAVIAGAAGLVGTGNCVWFNPWYSSQPGDAIPGTVNSQALVDWIVPEDTYESSNTDFVYLDSFVTGELFDLPAGAVQSAFGIQYRDTQTKTSPSPLNLRGDSYNSPADSFITDLSSEVNAVFAEFDIPITDQINVIAAVRREDFKDFDLQTTVPKVSVRYEPITNLAFRASYGEGFVAPSLGQRGPRQFDSQCVEVFTATNDPFGTGTIQGASSCFSANPNLGAEESTLKNIGMSWKATDNLEFSVDYQYIEFVDRIVTPASNDLVTADFANYQAALVDGSVPGLTGTLATDLPIWLASGMSEPLIERDPVTNQVLQVTRIPVNSTSNEVGVWDFAARYDLDTNFGFFIATMRASAFHKYLYQKGDAPLVDGVGDQNADTELAPPIPRWKGNMRLSWLNNNHSASIGADFVSHVEFDDAAIDTSNIKNRVAPNSISSHTTIDVRYSYLFDDLLGGEMQFTVGSNNVTDSNPDPLPIAGGLETRLHDPFGRTFYIEIGYEPTF